MGFGWFLVSDDFAGFLQRGLSMFASPTVGRGTIPSYRKSLINDLIVHIRTSK